jgi:membrane protein YdbS with pleckstrin-like domain
MKTRARALRGLQPGESVLRVYRRHPLLLVRPALPGLALLLTLPLPVAALSAARSPLLVPLGGGLLALGVAWLAWAWADWRADWLVLTDKRVLWVERTPWVRERRWEAPLGSLQTVAAVSAGPIARLTGCADLVLDTASRGVQRVRGLRRAHEAASAILATQRHAARRSKRLERLRSAMQVEPPAIGATEPESPRAVVWRRHPWLLAKGVLSRPVPLLLAGVILSAAPGGSLCLALAATGALVWTVWLWDDWRNDEIVVTAERIVQVRRSPLRLRDESWHASIEKVQDVAYEVPNLLAHLLDYGTLTVKTGGDGGDFELPGVPRPREASAELNRRVQLRRGRKDRELLREVEETVRSVLRMHGL